MRLATEALRLVALLALAAPAQAAPLTEGKRLASVYDTILQAHFEKAEAQFRETCPPAPATACKALGVVSTWWQILLDPTSRLLDSTFEERTSEAITASEAWTRSEPRRAEAWFYLAGAYAPLVQWRVLRGQRLAAARGGKKIKDALERTLELDPELNDAYFGIGLYHYYADVAPMTAKVLRWLLLLPGGDRLQGLREMLRARERGELLTGEADYQLQQVYLWYEQKPLEALALLERLDRRYPTNPLFLQRIAETQSGYLHDHPASAAAWRTLLSRALSGQLYGARRTEMRARIGLARELDSMDETDRTKLPARSRDSRRK